MSLDVTVIESTASNFPSALRTCDGTPGFPCLWALGNLAILQRRLLGFFCSTWCPGEMILRTYDLARVLRDAGVTVISGFHSPMEKECLTLLLRGTQPVIVCPARGIGRMRPPTAWKAPLAEKRVLILSPFGVKQRRVTADLAEKRNEFVATLADEVFVAHAARGSKTERFCHDVLAWGRPLLTLENDANAHLLTLGARPVRPENVSDQWAVNPQKLPQKARV